MPFQFLCYQDNAIGTRVYRLLQQAYDIIHKEPALAGLRIRQALEEIGRFRLWTKHGYPLREDNEPYEIHKQAHSIYQRISSLLHIETIDPFDDDMVRRTARLQLRRMHALTLLLYPQKGVQYIPPAALQEKADEEADSDFASIQEEIDDLDDTLCGEEDFFMEMSDEEFSTTKADLTQKVSQNKSLEDWERALLLFEIDLAQVAWDIRKRQYENILPADVQKRIEKLLASGQTQALPTIYEYYRRRQESALNDFCFEKAYEESKALLDRLKTQQDNLAEINLSVMRNPLRGRVLSTFGRIVAIHAHSYEAITELDRAHQLFLEAETELVETEARTQQQLLMIQTMLEKKRIDPSLELDSKIDALLLDIDKQLTLYVEDKLPQEILRIDLRIACRLKVALIRKEKYPLLSRLSAKVAQEIDAIEEHIHHPWEQICGLIYALQPNNTPKEIKAVLQQCASISPDTAQALLGIVARAYLLEGKYRKGEKITERDKEEFISSLSPFARNWWEQYEIATRFHARCDHNKPGSPIDVFPFDLA